LPAPWAPELLSRAEVRLLARLALLVIAMVALAEIAMVALAPAAAGAAPVTRARLQGAFELAGRVTVAYNVQGERAGQTVDRTWTFQSTCPVGQCPTVSLLRARASGSDVLVLHRRGPERYSASSSFFSPLSCAGRVYPRGQKVLFTITVRITLAEQVGPATIATRVAASYQNRRRINRTPCVAVLGHDAARYHGHLVSSA
jgi:hypothetical protein